MKSLKKKKIDISKYLQIVQLNGKINLEPFKIEFITLTHSILEPNGLKIDTPVGSILHTGDWKCDPNPLIGDKIDENRLKKIGNEGVLAMICDSTNVFSAGRAGSESDVRKNLLKVIDRLNKKISQEIIVIQRIRYDNYKPELNNFLSKEIKLEQLYEEQFAGNFFTRISRVIY